jgi:transcriptional regulator with XRE-family HTH domain
MKITNVYSDKHRTTAEKAKEKEVRDLFQNWKPGPEELLASGKWHGPIVVEGQAEFWQAIRQVRAFREAHGMTLKDVSDRCGIDVATLSKLENGKQANPTLFTMLLYVGAVGMRLNFNVSERQVPTVQVAERHERQTSASKSKRKRKRTGARGHEVLASDPTH